MASRAWVSKVFMGDSSVMNKNYSSVISISAHGLGPDCAQSLVMLRASRARVFSADHRLVVCGMQREGRDACALVVLILVGVLIWFLCVWVEVTHRDLGQ